MHWDGRSVILSQKGACLLKEDCWMWCIVWEMSRGFVRMFPSSSFIQSTVTWSVAMNILFVHDLWFCV